jgi:hypothetical protein
MAAGCALERSPQVREQLLALEKRCLGCDGHASIVMRSGPRRKRR